METRQRQWTTWGVAAAGCAALAIGYMLAAPAAGGRPAIAPLQPFATPMAQAPVACASELYAFIKVAEAARDLGSDRSILSFALDDLQANLADCLKGDDETELRDAIDAAAPRQPWFRDM